MSAKKTRVYISGPISGYADLNRPAFEEAKSFLEKIGYDAVSPLDSVKDDSPQKSYVEYMVDGLRLLDGCDAIFMLSGWRFSPGARMELLFAVREKKEILYNMLDVLRFLSKNE